MSGKGNPYDSFTPDEREDACDATHVAQMIRLAAGDRRPLLRYLLTRHLRQIRKGS